MFESSGSNFIKDVANVAKDQYEKRKEDYEEQKCIRKEQEQLKTKELETIKTTKIIFKIKNGKKETDTIIRIAQHKFPAFRARIKFLKNNNEEIDLFDLAGNSKRQLQVCPKGEKYKPNGNLRTIR